MQQGKEGTGRRFLGGAAWSALDFWTQQVGGFLVLLLVGRIAGPDAVGVMATAQLLVALGMVLLLDGFSDALVQRDVVEPHHIDSAFWLLFVAGCVAGLVMLALAPLAALVFGQPQLAVLLPMLAIGLPLVGVSAALQGMMQRGMRFRLLATRTVAAQAAGIAVAVLLASRGFGAGALVGHFLVSRLVDSAILFLFGRFRPGVAVRAAALRDILRYGRHRVGNQFVGFLVMQVDRFSVALFLSPAIIGLYALAERLALSLINGVSGVATRAAFPMLSARKHDADSFAAMLRDLLLAVNLAAVPAFIGLAAISPELMLVLMGPAWHGAALPLALLALAGIPHASNYLVATSVNALGRPDLMFRISLHIMLMRILASLIAAPFGIVAVAAANLLATSLSTPMLLRAVRKVLPGADAAVLAGASIPLAAGVVMAAAVLGAAAALEGHPPVLLLLAKVVVGVVAYPAATWLLATRTQRDRARLLLLRRSAVHPAASGG